MQGMRFLIVTEKGPINHGVIAQQITPEKYLCNFAKVPSSSRVCSIEEIQGWNLFPNDEAMNTFISAYQAQATPGPKKKVAKKRVAKKKKISKPRVVKKIPVIKRRGKKVAKKKKVKTRPPTHAKS